jgi:hypothetical protein
VRDPRCPKARPVAVMCPVEPDMLQALKVKLRRMPRGTVESPLRKTGRTHFGRWVVIERLCDEDGNPSSDELTVPYLLFTANIDGDEASYLRVLVERSQADMHEIWSHCIGYRFTGDDAGLVAYLLANRIRTHLFFTPYPTATVDKVASAVNLRRGFIDFAVRSDGIPAAELRQNFFDWYRRQPGEVTC